jgi:ribosomal protein L16/L10AE
MSSTSFSPKKYKFLRVHTTPARGHLLRPFLHGSSSGVFASGFGQLSWRHLEAGRRFLTRQLRRARVKVRVKLTQALTAKAKQARMGKGKGKFKIWSGFTRPNTMLYEMGSTTQQAWQEHTNPTTRITAKFPFERIRYKFPFPVKIIRRTPVQNKSQTKSVFSYKYNGETTTQKRACHVKYFHLLQKSTFHWAGQNEKNSKILNKNFSPHSWFFYAFSNSLESKVKWKTNKEKAQITFHKIGRIIRHLKLERNKKKIFFIFFNEYVQKLSVFYPSLKQRPVKEQLHIIFESFRLFISRFYILWRSRHYWSAHLIKNWWKQDLKSWKVIPNYEFHKLNNFVKTPTEAEEYKFMLLDPFFKKVGDKTFWMQAIRTKNNSFAIILWKNNPFFTQLQDSGSVAKTQPTSIYNSEQKASFCIIPPVQWHQQTKLHLLGNKLFFKEINCLANSWGFFIPKVTLVKKDPAKKVKAMPKNLLISTRYQGYALSIRHFMKYMKKFRHRLSKLFANKKRKRKKKRKAIVKRWKRRKRRKFKQRFFWKKKVKNRDNWRKIRQFWKVTQLKQKLKSLKIVSSYR